MKTEYEKKKNENEGKRRVVKGCEGKWRKMKWNEGIWRKMTRDEGVSGCQTIKPGCDMKCKEIVEIWWEKMNEGKKKNWIF